jgi:superfamily II DNA or RNA helicase
MRNLLTDHNLDIKLRKENESFIKVICEKSIAQELHDYFSFYVPNFQFTPAYKNKLWNGKIYLFNLQTSSIYFGLVSHLIKFAKERKYSLSIDPQIQITVNFSLNEAKNFIETLKIPFEVRDYQLNAFVQTIRNKRLLLLSPTASGKSLILYLIVSLLQKTCERGLLIVPTTSLVNQMFSDFKSYGYDSEENCHIIYSGKDKQSDKYLFISTWQAIYKNPSEYFEQFDFVLGDECHLFKAKSLTTIMNNLVNAQYRVGCTGTLDGTQTHKLVLEGLFGPVYQTTTTSELIQKKHLSEFSIKCLILKHPEDMCEIVRKEKKYLNELRYIISNTKRNQFIKNLVLSLKGNSLVLFQLVEKHGKELFEIIKNESKDRHVFFVFGGTDVEVRESIRSITEKENNAIIVASYGTFSTGINIRNLHNIIFASPSKSKIRNLQSIGRGLRLGENKTEAILYDIVDDLRVGKHKNYALQHFLERVKIYDENKFNYKFYNIELK